MGKYHKTREQKIAAATKHQQNIIQYSLPQGFVVAKPIISAVHTKTYDYVIRDVQKTILISSILVILQLITFLLLKQHIVKIPGLMF